jgi:hypothetical protein
MPGLDPGIHLLRKTLLKDCRVKPGNDEREIVSRTRCGILHAAAQSRDRTRHRRSLRPRLSNAPLRKSYALRCVRGTNALEMPRLVRAFFMIPMRAPWFHLKELPRCETIKDRHSSTL